MQLSCIYMPMTLRPALYFLIVLLGAAFSSAQENPYFVTYDHHMEEPGNLEVETFSTVGVPRSGPRAYFAPYMEMEYGITAKWTSELYLEAQSTHGDSTVFTGWRLENRFRPLSREHWINPVLYAEYENLNEASHIQKGIVGSGPEFGEPNSVLRRTKAHELETKLILSSNTHDWNFAENFTVEKNLSKDEGFEFGYSFAFSRPLGALASGNQCRFCRENFSAGAEFYGGLGSTNGFGVRGNPHYIAPVIAWQISDNASLHFSPGFGLNQESNRVLFRFGYSYEIRGFGTRMARLFGAKP